MEDILHQLRLVVYSIIYRALYIQTVVEWDFLNHQQYLPYLSRWSIASLFAEWAFAWLHPASTRDDSESGMHMCPIGPLKDSEIFIFTYP